MSTHTWAQTCSVCGAEYQARQRHPKLALCYPCRRERALANGRTFREAERDELVFLRRFVGLAASAVCNGTFYKWAELIDWQAYADKYGQRPEGGQP